MSGKLYLESVFNTETAKSGKSYLESLFNTETAIWPSTSGKFYLEVMIHNNNTVLIINLVIVPIIVIIVLFITVSDSLQDGIRIVFKHD